MRDAGLRGVELQPVYPVAVDDPSRGIRNTRYFSPEWFELLRHTLRETRRLDLQFDFTLGSGWPYGGPFVPENLGARKIELLSRNVEGEFTWELGPLLEDLGRVFAVVAAPVLPSREPDVQHSKIITHEYRRGRIGPWTVPSGEWRIMIFVDAPTRQSVKRPTLGMEGWVIDHFSREAMDLFLNAAGTQIVREIESVASPPFFSVFCDSLEVFGADWTSSFLQEFERRRGYDFTPYLAALWQEAGALTPHLRYDYHLTLSDLMMENLFRPLAAWSHEQGMTARVQAHGAMGDVMRGYGLSDIPEGEEGEGADRYSVDIGHRRLASSAAHVYQKPVVSCESYTWLRVPLFMTTLEMMKGATDSSFLDGINQIVNQGYPYSPPQAGEPGWLFYASTLVNHNNIWWRHYSYLARYIQRAAATLQRGVSVNPVAVYVPLADVFAKHGAGSLTMDTEIARHLGPELFSELRQAGYDFDFINDHALAQAASVDAGKLKAGTGVYSVVIVPPTQFMPSESMERLVEFAQDGGSLIFIGRVPEAAPGLKEQASRTARLRHGINTLWKNAQPKSAALRSSGKGKVALVRDLAAALAHLHAALAPDFQILAAGDSSPAALQSAAENVGFAHRREGSADFYFVSNLSPHFRDLRVRFPVGHRAPERWNAESGTVEKTLVYEYSRGLDGGQATDVQLRLEAFESCFVVFGSSSEEPLVTRATWPGALEIKKVKGRIQVRGLLPCNEEYSLSDARGKVHGFSIANLPEPVPVNGPWELKLGEKPPMSLAELRSWAELPEGMGYSGWASYETTVGIGDLGREIEWLLDLGAVHETADVTLNGIPLGAAWKSPRRVSCKNALRAGANRLKVEVGNLWIEKMRLAPKTDHKAVAETFGIRWGTYGEIAPKEIPPSGLLGPVRLIPLKRWTVKL